MKLKTDDTSLITAQQPDAPTPETPDAAQSPRRSLWKTWIADLLLFCFTGIYVELCLHLCVYHKLDRHTIYLILFALQAGVFFSLLTSFLPKILRQNDLLYTGYDEKMDYRGACMLIYRFAALAGINTNVDQSQLLQVMSDNSNLTREAAKAMLWCNQKDITSRDSNLGELLDAYNTRISRYQMTSFLFYLCTYELNLGS